MADARNILVWDQHALEQHEQNKTTHITQDDQTLREWPLRVLTPPNNKILDFGCGSGLWKTVFTGFDYYGSDQNKNMIKYAKMRFPEEQDRFTVHSWDKLSFEDNTFDMVFTSSVLQHNQHPDKVPVMREITRVLKPGSYFMCSENTFREDNYHHTFGHRSRFHERLDDGYSYTVRGWCDFMSCFGLELIEFRHPSEYLFRKT